MTPHGKGGINDVETNQALRMEVAEKTGCQPSTWRNRLDGLDGQAKHIPGHDTQIARQCDSTLK